MQDVSLDEGAESIHLVIAPFGISRDIPHGITMIQQRLTIVRRADHEREHVLLILRETGGLTLDLPEEDGILVSAIFTLPTIRLGSGVKP